MTQSTHEGQHHHPAGSFTLQQIDRSTRPSVIFFFSFALIWLLIGTALALIASIKMHAPDFLKGIECLTFGRARSAHLNAMVFGWGNNAIFGVSLWMMARLCQTPLRHGALLTLATIFWNFGVTLGIVGILTGGLTSVEWLEMPPYVSLILGAAYILISIWSILAFRQRQTHHVYVSQWYMIGALFWFPWLYTIAQFMILWFPARGTVQSITNWWFAHNVLGLWITPMALAAIYYFIPKVLGKPIHSYYLSVLGFWTLALFYNWAGVHHLIGGPIPVWLTSVGTIASVMMFIPVLVTAINHHMTVVGSFKHVWVSPTLRFIVFAAMSYTLVSLAGSSMALRIVNVTSHFTHLTVGHAHHGVYAFFTMAMFGSMYFIMPRLLEIEWPSAKLIHLHFWGTAIGISLMVIVLHVGGWLQGEALNNSEIRFLDIVQKMKPYLHIRSVSGFLITIGHIAFFINYFWMLARYRMKLTYEAAERALHTLPSIKNS
jgi:cytochrome c oxidase cbb3-type subunit 1